MTNFPTNKSSFCIEQKLHAFLKAPLSFQLNFLCPFKESPLSEINAKSFTTAFLTTNCSHFRTLNPIIFKDA